MDFLIKIIHKISSFIPLDIDNSFKLLFVKAILLAFVLGYIFSFLINLAIKVLLKKVKNKFKNMRTTKRRAKSIKVPGGKYIGEVTQFLSKINVVVIKINSGKLKVGDNILIKGHATEVMQKVSSMQINRKNVESAKKGVEVGLMIEDVVKTGDLVFKLKN